LEEAHSEGPSPFVAVNEGGEDQNRQAALKPEEEPGNDEDGNSPAYAECPIDNCGEMLLVEEMGYHIELHADEEDMNEVDASEQSSDPRPKHNSKSAARPRREGHWHDDQVSSIEEYNSSSSKRNRQSSIQAWKKIFSMPKPSASKPKASTAVPTASLTEASEANKSGGHRRLGKLELGKHAHEQKMPDSLAEHLRRNWGVKMAGVIPVLEQLLEQNHSTKYAYLCHHAVQHVSKLKREGKWYTHEGHMMGPV